MGEVSEKSRCLFCFCLGGLGLWLLAPEGVHRWPVGIVMSLSMEGIKR
jgi:hypothetical protein